MLGKLGEMGEGDEEVEDAEEKWTGNKGEVAGDARSE